MNVKILWGMQKLTLWGSLPSNSSSLRNTKVIHQMMSKSLNIHRGVLWFCVYKMRNMRNHKLPNPGSYILVIFNSIALFFRHTQQNTHVREKLFHHILPTLLTLSMVYNKFIYYVKYVYTWSDLSVLLLCSYDWKQKIWWITSSL